MTTSQTRVGLSSATTSSEAGMTASGLLGEMQFPHTRGNGYHQITAVHDRMEVGWLRWNDGSPSGRNAAGSGIRYLMLPIEAVACTQSGDFGVSMSEIPPNGYITPGSFTNDRQYRVSELAEDIRRNGVERPLRIYMGRTRPVVWDGQHRYAAAAIMGATHLPVEITYSEDVRDVIEWARTALEPSAGGGVPRLSSALAAENFPHGPAAGLRPGNGAGTSSGQSAHSTARRRPDQGPPAMRRRGPR